MSQVYTYRDKVFQYDAALVQALSQSLGIDVFEKVREGIDTLIAENRVFHRVIVTASTADATPSIVVKPFDAS